VIDLHCHLLPGIDDGPSTVEESVALAAAAVQDGVQVLASTPHVRHDHPGVIPGELAGRCDDLRSALGQAGIDLEIVSAGEVDLAWAMSASEEDLRLVTYGGRGTDVLLETPYGPLPPNFEERVFELFASRGMRVLLAHPERSMSFQSDAGRLRALIDRGVLVQVTAQSLLRRSGASRSRAVARWLVKEGLAHVIASDAHGDASRAGLGDAVEAAARVDRARAGWMVTEAPAAVLAGKPLGDPPRAAKRRWRLR
jgi:protein-tyrosine phosphatase